MAINNFADVQNFFSAIDASQAPHGNFWKQNSDLKASFSRNCREEARPPIRTPTSHSRS